jgi:hypothetical protein
MPLYWARFERRGTNLFRFDTRIYLEDLEECGPDDTVVGAVVAKNPGSARPSDDDSTVLHPITLTNDKLLPTVRSLVRQAYDQAGIEPPPGAYVQVLNLFYLCEKDYGRAIQAIRGMTNRPLDATEENEFPWIMYLWGEYHGDKAPYIRRFRTLNSCHHFYFDKNRDELVVGVPGAGSFAKHTQGLKLGPVIEHVAALIDAATDQAE